MNREIFAIIMIVAILIISGVIFIYGDIIKKLDTVIAAREKEVSFLRDYTLNSLRAYDTLPDNARKNFCVGLYYLEVNSPWKKTVFIKQRFFIGAHTTDTLNPKSIYVKRDEKGNLISCYKVYAALLCKSFSVTNNGLSLYLVDPYSDVQTTELIGLDEDKALILINRLLFVEGIYEPDKGLLHDVSFNLTNCYGDGGCRNGQSPRLEAYYSFNKEEHRYIAQKYYV